MIGFGGRSIDELSIGYDCDVDRTTGAANVRVPVPLPPGRNGFGPSFSLTYSSGSGNSPFGAGWTLTGLPTIGINTREHVPKWNGTDGYQLSGDELVPWLEFDGTGWRPRGFTDGDWSVAFLRSRTGGSQIRVEKWVHRTTGRVHFRTRDARNAVTIFGARPDGLSRIADPNDATRTFVWLPEVQIDSVGNAVWFEYEPETLDGVDRGASFERRRSALAQRYLKRIRYGNAQPVTLTNDILAGMLPAGVRWCFQGVFDYGDHSALDIPAVMPDRAWPVRRDPFSTCRSGFDIRTYRLCRRILSFHDFDELGAGATLTGVLVLTHDEEPAGSTLREITYIGHRRDGEARTHRALPPLRMTYAGPFMGPAFVAAPVETQRNVPAGLAASRYTFVDLFGEGLPGILAESERAWFYKANEGGGRFGEQALVIERPATRPGAFAFGDVNRDGNTDLSQLAGRMAGLFSHDRQERRWDGFRPFEALPHVEGIRRAQWVDLNGDGRPDIVIPKGDRLAWFASKGETFADPVEVSLPAAAVPNIAEDPMLDLFFADMNGDGLVDLVRVGNGRVEYWPSLGNGHFGESVLLEDSPRFAPEGEFDAARLRFIDLDGSGTTDLVYLGRGEVSVWRNASGNRITPGPRMRGLPYLDSVSTIGVLDFLGDGRPCLVWSTPLPGQEASLYYLPLAAVERPRLLLSVDDSLGQETRFSYSSSATHYLRDQHAGVPWSTRLPVHMSVVDRREVIEAIGGTRSVQRFEYRDGFYDGVERQFRGFGRVDMYDGVPGAVGPEPDLVATAPSLVRTWVHVGPATRRPLDGIYAADAELPLLSPDVIDNSGLTAGEIEDAQRAAAGRIIRTEIWSVDERGVLASHPFQVTQASFRLRRVQPAWKSGRSAFEVLPEETLEAVYEQTPGDPRVSQTVTIDVDEFGIPVVSAEIAHARRTGQPRDIEAQGNTTVLVNQNQLVHFNNNNRFELGVPIEAREFELTGLVPASGRITRAELRSAAVSNALAAPLLHHEALPPGIAARLSSWDQSFYWNDDRTARLPFGEIGRLVLVHHEESACFSRAFVDSVYGGRVNDAMLNAARYVNRDGLLWQADETHFFGGAARFFQREALEQPDGSRASFEYDAYALEITAQVDALSGRVQAVIDYHTLAASRITDANGNVTEVRYDPLGAIVAMTSHGHVEAQPWGFEPMAAIVPRMPADVADLLARPDHYLQGASQFVYYDLDAWRRAGTPPVTVRLTREDLRHDGRGNVATDGRIQIALSYSDGLGRTVQAKNMVEPGPAIQRDAGGVVVNAAGRPVLADAPERWQVSGHVAYDAKQQPRRQYEPYFSPTWQYESDAVLRQFGVATLVSFDALGRETGQFLPNGTYTRTTHRAWSVDRADANDTVMDSAYRAMREARPADDPEKQALEHAKQHAGTTSTAYLEPSGLTAGTLELGGATAGDRRSESRLDSQGEVVATIDPRGLTAFSYRRDMQGRVLHMRSIDAGDSWSFYDAQDRLIRVWDGRGFEVEQGYDALDRPTTVHARGNGLDHIVEERTYGGNDVASMGSNLSGALIRIRDQSGEVTVGRYDPAGQPLTTTRRIRTGTGEADWRAAEPLEATVFTTETAFDGLGRLCRAVLPDDSTRTLTYLQGGGLLRQVVTTADGKVVDIAVLDGASYDARGLRSGIGLGNGVSLEYRYDDETFRLTRQTARNAARTLQDAQYTYDPAGNIVRIVDGALTGPNAIVTGSILPPRRDYAYDAHYRLTRATGRVHQALLQHDYIPALGGPIKGTRHITLNNGAALEAFTRRYEYDDSGNLRRVRHVGTTQNWTTDLWISPASNRSLPALDNNGIAVSAPEMKFDAAGNLTALDHLRAVDWSWRSTISRAVIIERPGDVDDDEVYTYAADGTRVRKVTTRKKGDGIVEVIEKVYFGDCERKRVTLNGALILERWTSHFRSGNERIALLHRWTRDDLGRETDDIAPARWRYQLATHQGSSSVELDENGNVVSYEEYFPYGGSSFIGGDNVRDVQIKEYRYSGKERDDATSLYYFGHRYYAPWMCRWMSPDPIGPQDDLNLYQFVLGDPVGNVDPDGLQTMPRTRGRFEVVEVVGLPEWARPTWAGLTPEQRATILGPNPTHTLIITDGRVEYVTRREGIRRLEALRRGGTNVTRFDPVLPRPPPPPPPEITEDTPVEHIEFEAEIITAGPEPDQQVTLDPGDPDATGPGGGDGGARRRSRTRSGGASGGTRRRSGSGGRRRGSGTGGGGGSGSRGTGPGTGQRGRGPGGGGTSETVPAQPAAANGEGEGATGGSGGAGQGGLGAGANPSPNPDAPPPGASASPAAEPAPAPTPSLSPPSPDGGPPQTSDPEAQTRRGSPNGSHNGSEAGMPGGVAGGQGRRHGANGTGRGTSGGSTGPSGTGTDTGGATSPGLDPSATGAPAPPGLRHNGTDVNGAIDGDPNASRDSSRNGRTGGIPDGNPQGSPTGSREGTQGGSAQGQPGGTSTSGTGGAAPAEPESALDVATRWAGYANFEFSQGSPGGQRGGIPGASGRLNLGAFGQIAYIALTIVSWIGPGAALKGLRLGFRAAMRGLTALGGALARVSVRGIARAVSRAVMHELPQAVRLGWNAARARFLGGSLLDNSVLSAIAAGDREAIRFATRNANRLYINTTVAAEAIRRYGAAGLAKVSRQFGIRQVPSHVGRARMIMQNLGITSLNRLSDMTVLATAERYGLRLVAGDTRLVTASLRHGWSGARQLAARMFDPRSPNRIQWYQRIRAAVQQWAPGVNPNSITGSPIGR